MYNFYPKKEKRASERDPVTFSYGNDGLVPIFSSFFFGRQVYNYITGTKGIKITYETNGAWLSYVSTLFINPFIRKQELKQNKYMGSNKL